MRGELEGLSIVVRKWHIWANSVLMAFIPRGGREATSDGAECVIRDFESAEF